MVHRAWSGEQSAWGRGQGAWGRAHREFGLRPAGAIGAYAPEGRAKAEGGMRNAERKAKGMEHGAEGKGP